MTGRGTEIRGATAALRFILRLVWFEDRRLGLACVGLTVLLGCVPVVSLVLLKLIVDALASSLDGRGQPLPFLEIAELVALAGLVALIQEWGRSLLRLARANLGTRTTTHLTSMLHDKVSALRLSSIEDPSYYDVLHRALKDGPTGSGHLVGGMIELGLAGVSSVAIVLVLALIDWRLATILPFSLIPSVLQRFASARRFRGWSITAAPKRRLADYLTEINTDGQFAKEVRAFGLSEYFKQRYLRTAAGLNQEHSSLRTRRLFGEMVTDGAAILVIFSVFAFIAYRVAQGQGTVGDVAMFYQAFVRARVTAQTMLVESVELYEDSLAFTGFLDLLSLPTAPSRPTETSSRAQAPRDAIVLSNVSFSYPGHVDPVFEDLSLRIPAGGITAIVGENGSGKSTLVKLLCRLYGPQAGSITVDGRDLSTIPQDEWCRLCSVLFQDYARYHFSARENIVLSCIERSDDEQAMIRAARRSTAHEFLEELPLGYDTMTSTRFEGGRELSGGEWQRLALARILFRDAQVVILDEATSYLDARAEAEFLQNLRDSLTGRTAILVTHNLRATRMADQIYVLSDGSCAEFGTHEELVARNGAYRQMFEKQLLQECAE